MCAKPEPFSYLQPIATLHEELAAAEQAVLTEFKWAGIVTFYGVLENI